MTEVEVYLDFDRLPEGIGQLKNDRTKYVSELDIQKLRKWASSKVAGHADVHAIITGQASRYLNMVVAVELANHANVSKIGWCQAGQPPQTIKDFCVGEN